MHEQHGFTWLSLIPGLGHAPNHVLMAVLVAGVLVITTFVARGQLARATAGAEGGLVPDDRWSYRNFFEVVAESLYKLTESVMGHHEAPKYYPVIGTLFVFVFASNIIGLVPGFLPSTENMNTTLALGLFVFIFYNFEGFKASGLAYLKHFWGPVFWLGPLMLVIELLGHVFRPFSLALRLQWNIRGDHVVLGVFSGQVPYLLPVIFYGLGVFVAFIQAFVFCLLTMVYISLSTAHDEH
jgi:F-type H+-transporting ATPase subunit a